MIKYKEIYNRLKEKRKNRAPSKNKGLNREGYGYIKRRMGLLSNEVQKPTYSSEKEQ